MIEITHEKLEINPWIEKLTYPDCGAINVFLGVARDHHLGKKVISLSYEAYEPFAIKALEDIRQEMLDRFEIRDLAVVHRLGPVAVKEASLLVVVSAAHRGPSLDATREFIERLKQDVPIWKKEHYEDGSQWIEPTPK